jgi:hypothetical protein
MRKPLVAILGCGPSGLLAAHACWLNDIPFVIFSRKRKSNLGGAQFSHIPIPGLYEEEDASKLTYHVEGDAETYQRKVYGSSDIPFVSFDNVVEGQVVQAWPLRDSYETLWDRFEDSIVDLDISPVRARSFGDPFDLTFSSLHLKTICLGRMGSGINHWFRDQPVRIANEAINPNIPDNSIWYDGTKDHSWYRQSRIFGVGSTEWGGSSPLPPVEDVRTVVKPIDTNCDCHPNLIRIGRFGAWKKGLLTSHAYGTVVDVING